MTRVLPFVVGLVFLVFFFGAFTPVFADEDSDLLGASYGEHSGLSNVDPRVSIPRIINAALGLLGTIATVLVIYSGFLWMTSAGNEDKVEKAKKILWTSVIGIIIIMSAYSITSFVIRQGCEATSGSNVSNADRKPCVR